ncbi:MAG: NADH-quinone oxidoreductase subunit H, partial [Chromatiales bacterium]|nr:NADH-quinone oxidoreductase subunit H [Chromatiales bacterium]
AAVAAARDRASRSRWRRCSTGWVNQCRAWLQNRRRPAAAGSPTACCTSCSTRSRWSPTTPRALFRTAPYVVFGCMVLACAIIPTLSTDLPLAPAADAIALVGLFALARVFISLAAMDIGTAFGTLGARREMLIGFLAEPALLMVLFSASLISQSTSLTDHRRDAGPPRARHLPGPGLRRRRLRDGVAGRERARAGGQPGHPPRADDDPRGADPRILRAATWR